VTDISQRWRQKSKGIREIWAETKDHLRGFAQFKDALDDILEMDDYYDE